MYPMSLNNLSPDTTVLNDRALTLDLLGVRYHVRISGRGQPFLLLHGFSGSAANWAHIAQALQSSFQVIAPDLLGHGQTESPHDPERYRIEHAASDTIALLDMLKIPSTHLLGYSMGGRLALFMAVTYPARVRTLTLESASPGLAMAEERAARERDDEALAARIEQEGVAWFASYWEALPLFATQSEKVRAALRTIRLTNQPHGLANSLRGMGTGVQPSLWERLGELRCPTLLIAGALDTKFVEIAQRMAATIPGAQLCIVPNAGHAVHQEEPSQYVRYISDHARRFRAIQA